MKIQVTKNILPLNAKNILIINNQSFFVFKNFDDARFIVMDTTQNLYYVDILKKILELIKEKS